MSVQVPLNIFSYSEKQILLQNLTVVAQEKESKSLSKKPNPYKKDTTLYGFEIITKNNIEYILLPFFYCYNFLSNKLKIKFPNENKIYKKNKLFQFPFKLRPYQEDIKLEALDILNRTHSLILSLYTGSGKTFFSLYLSHKIGLITAISVNRIGLIEQWIKSIKQFCPGAKYQVIGSKTEIDKDVNFYIFNMTNISKRLIHEFDHVGLLICDEVHTLCTPSNYKTLFYFQPKYLICLSATPYRTDKLSDIIHLYFGVELIYRELYRPFNAYCCYTDFIPKVKDNSLGNLDWNSVLNSVCGEEILIDLVVEIARFFITRNILILTKRVEMEGMVYFNKLREYNEKVDIYTGEKNYYDENCRLLISTCSKAGIGFDFPKLDMLIIASDMEESFIQYLGRVFRKEETFPIIIDVVHCKFRPLYNHFNTRKDIYTKSGGEIKNIFREFPELWQFLNYYKPIRIL